MFLLYHIAKVFTHKGRTSRCHGNHIHSPSCKISQCVLAQALFRQELAQREGMERGRANHWAQSDLRASHGHPDDPSGSRKTKKADAVPCPQVDVRPIHLLSLSGDRKGARQQRTRQGRGRPEWEDEKWAKPKRQKNGIDRMRWYGQGNVSDIGMRQDKAADRTVCSSSHPSARSLSNRWSMSGPNSWDYRHACGFQLK